MAHTCLVCNKKLPAGSRVDMKFCGQKCRSKAYNERKRVMKRMKYTNLDLLQQQDLQTIELHSVIAATFIRQIAAIAGKEVAENALDAMWDLAASCGCDLTERFNRGSA